VCDKGAGSALLLKPKRIAEIAQAADRSMSVPLTLKTRKGYYDDKDVSGREDGFGIVEKGIECCLRLEY
jgi:tRNA-dihydrouridine synthase